VDGRVVSFAVLVACGVNEQGHHEVLAMEPIMEESKESYSQLFQSLQQQGLETPSLVVSDANKGLVSAIERAFLAPPGNGVKFTS
jgi:putative transposase